LFCFRIAVVTGWGTLNATTGARPTSLQVRPERKWNVLFDK